MRFYITIDTPDEEKVEALMAEANLSMDGIEAVESLLIEYIKDGNWHYETTDPANLR